MKNAPLILAVLVLAALALSLPAHGAAVPEVAASHTKYPRAPVQTISLAQAPFGTCASEVQPAAWHDPSDALTFAMHPTVQHDAQEAASPNLASLIDVRVLGGAIRLYLFGAPATERRPLAVTFVGAHTGWALRWPYC